MSMFMKRNQFLIIASLIIILVLSACAPADRTSVTQPISRTISVTGNGMVYLTPDIAYIYIGVHTEADTVSDALSQNNAQAVAVANSLKELGVEGKDIQTSAFNVYPLQVYGPSGEVTGTKYVVDNIVFVTVRDLASLGKMLDVVVRSGANTINSISFDVADKKQAIAEARKLAIEAAKKQAEEIASAAGVELGEIQYINIYSSFTPSTPFYGYGGAKSEGMAAVPIASGQMMISADANITYNIK